MLLLTGMLVSRDSGAKTSLTIKQNRQRELIVILLAFAYMDMVLATLTDTDSLWILFLLVLPLKSSYWSHACFCPEKRPES